MMDFVMLSAFKATEEGGAVTATWSEEAGSTVEAAGGDFISVLGGVISGAEGTPEDGRASAMIDFVMLSAFIASEGVGAATWTDVGGDCVSFSVEAD